METGEIIKNEFSLRLIDEGLQRIRKCISYLSDEELWHKPSTHTNAVGNLVLHLEGNVRQYILTGIGGGEMARKRNAEFDNNNRMEREALLNHIESTVRQAAELLGKTDPSDFTRVLSVQGFQMTVLSCIIHVIEHFSYHVGQITLYTKMLKDIDTGYYAGQDLEQ